jgi:hypothetical protein
MEARAGAQIDQGAGTSGEGMPNQAKRREQDGAPVKRVGLELPRGEELDERLAVPEAIGAEGLVLLGKGELRGVEEPGGAFARVEVAQVLSDGQ